MRAFLIAALCTSLSYAKPQYNYPAPSIPSGTYGVPGTGVTQPGDFTPPGGIDVGGDISNAPDGCFSGTVGVPCKQITNPAGGGGFGGGGLEGILFGGGGGLGGGGGFGGIEGGAAGGGTLIQKHIYVHVAPPEPEEARPQGPISVGQATKHYKIIFIKAPSYQSYQQQILQQQAQNEEKTLVYVLVKKPDEPADISVPTAAPAAPSKPEVYFIKYKAKSEVIGGGAHGSQLSGAGTGIGGGSATLSHFSASSANSQFKAASNLGLSTGDSSSSVFVGRPQTSYGPPDQSGPY